MNSNFRCSRRRAVIDSSDLSHVAYFFMTSLASIDQELRAAEEAWKVGNEGKARVCARRAVALAATSWSTRMGQAPGPADVMERLRRIQQHAAFPVSVREAAERLSTAVTKRRAMPFTVDPLADAGLIIRYLTADARDSELP